VPSESSAERRAEAQALVTLALQAAVAIRRATWLELALDRWIGPRYGSPWHCVLKGLLRRG
jgi:hypothetical protein